MLNYSLFGIKVAFATAIILAQHALVLYAFKKKITALDSFSYNLKKGMTIIPADVVLILFAIYIRLVNLLLLTGCSAGRMYGENCSKECPQNCLKDQCDILKGTCFACNIGYTGLYCESNCCFYYRYLFLNYLSIIFIYLYQFTFKSLVDKR